MPTKFKIIYAIRFFCGKLESGTIEFNSSPDATKEIIERDAMLILKHHRMDTNLKGSYALDQWLENVQKIDLTVTQII